MSTTFSIKTLISKQLNAETLRHKVFVGTFLTTAEFGLQKFLQLASNLILTRLLFPEAFGLMALVNVFLMGAQMLSDVGIKTAVIQMKFDDEDRFLNTAWTLQIIRGALIWLVLTAIAYPLSALYDEPQLFSLLCATSFIALVHGFLSINVTLAERGIRIHAVIAIKIVCQIIAIAVMCILAYIYESVWALAIGTIVGSVLTVIGSHIFLKGHKHRLMIDKAITVRLFKFGRWIFWGTLFTFFGGQGSRAIEGAFVSAETLGLISIAGMMAWAVGELVQKVIQSVAFPALSKVDRENKERFVATMHKLRRVVLVATIPVFGLVAIFAGSIIGLLYDERYQLATPFLAILAIGGAIGTLPMLYQNALLAEGNSRSHFVLTAITTVFRTVGLVCGFYLFGILGMMAGAVVGRCISLSFVYFMMLKRRWLDWKADMISLVAISAIALVTYYLNAEIAAKLA